MSACGSNQRDWNERWVPNFCWLHPRLVCVLSHNSSVRIFSDTTIRVFQSFLVVFVLAVAARLSRRQAVASCQGVSSWDKAVLTTTRVVQTSRQASKHTLSFLPCQCCNTNLLRCGAPRPTQNCAAGCSTALNQPTTASEQPPAVSPLRMHGSCCATFLNRVAPDTPRHPIGHSPQQPRHTVPHGARAGKQSHSTARTDCACKTVLQAAEIRRP
jgi:hypothetical protein